MTIQFSTVVSTAGTTYNRRPVEGLEGGHRGQPAVEALEKDWGKDWRREARVERWFSAGRHLIEKVHGWISQGCSAEAAVELVKRERESRSLDKFDKDYVRQKNGGVVVPRRGRAVAAAAAGDI